MTSIYTEVLEQTADSIEALSEELFTCATYQLLNRANDQQPAERIGSIMMYRINSGTVEKRQHLYTNAILDMKWHRNACCIPLLSSVDSKGEVNFYSMNDGDQLKLQHNLVIDENALGLSTDWFKTSKPEKVAYSMSTGTLVLVQLTESSPVILQSWAAHSFEAWIIACARESQNIFYSGADDSLMKIWDLRIGTDRACCTSKRHMMGVCSIQAHPSKDHILCSGSYDENVVVWDNRTMKKPLSEIKTGGGVWRLKWHPFGRELLLAACMHDGYKIIAYENDLCDPTVLQKYDKHESLAYGVDWCLDNDSCSDRANLVECNIACCSFYDKLLSVWKVSL